MLLTTQYLDEADRLSDSIAVIDHGRLIAEGTSDDLKSRVGGERLEITIADAALVSHAAAALEGMCEEPPVTDGARVLVGLPEGDGHVTDVVRRLDAAGVTVSDLSVRRPTLDDVFLTLTGRPAEEAEAESEAEEVAA